MWVTPSNPHFPLITHPRSPPLPISQLGTSDHPRTFLSTSNFTPRHIPLPTQFCDHFQCHTWAHPITHALSQPHPIRHLKTSDWPTTFPILSNFTPGHLPLSTQIGHYRPFHMWAHSIIHPMLPALPILLLGTLDSDPPSLPLAISDWESSNYTLHSP